MSKLVCGFGVNDSGYVVRKYNSEMVNGKQKQTLTWHCRIYSMWDNMIKRCYGSQNRRSYVGCEVSEDWRVFSKFKQWVEAQGLCSNTLVGLSLDKDIKRLGNKTYSPSNCIIVPRLINSLVVDDELKLGDLPSGVSVDHSRKKKYMVKVSNSVSKKREFVGRFFTENEAEIARLKYKLQLSHTYCDVYGVSENVRNLLVSRYNLKMQYATKDD